jgi:hypothetical protein
MTNQQQMVRLAEVLATAEARLERETQLRVRLEAGEMSYDILGLRHVVEKQNLGYK